MAVNYYVLEKQIMAGPEKGTIKQYGQVRMNDLTDFETICERITNNSTGTTGDVKGVLKSLVDIVQGIIRDGSIAQVGALGNFRPTTGSSGVEKKENLTAHLIRTPRITFFPGKKLRKMLRDVSYEQGKFIIVKELCPEDEIDL